MTTLDLIRSSPKFRAVLTDVDRIAPVDSAVLIQGETGTGKKSMREPLAVYDFTVTAHQARNLEAKLTNGSTHSVYVLIVLAWIPGVGDEAVDPPLSLTRRYAHTREANVYAVLMSPDSFSEWQTLLSMQAAPRRLAATIAAAIATL